MKKNYIVPQIEMVKLNTTDIIATSELSVKPGVGPGEGDARENWEWDEW